LAVPLASGNPIERDRTPHGRTPEPPGPAALTAGCCRAPVGRSGMLEWLGAIASNRSSRMAGATLKDVMQRCGRNERSLCNEENAIYLTMANDEQVKVLRQGAAAWNKWIAENPDEYIDLSEADLSEANLYKANLYKANLSGANLQEANLNWANLYKANLHRANLNWANLFKANLSEINLREADLSGAFLSGADLSKAYLIEADLNRADLSKADLSLANLSKANLSCANLSKANLNRADLSEADLSRAYIYKANLSETNLSGTVLIETNMNSAILTGCNISRVCAWELALDGAKQNDLIITPPDRPAISVDNFEVAQFINLLLHNENIRHVIDTITSNFVLILGRFTQERKTVLDAIRDELRQRDYLPVLFDFEKSEGRDLTDTISTLAHMARFVIADITDAKCILAELEPIVPDLPSVPIMPLILNSEYEHALFAHFKKYPWVSEPYRYETHEHLLSTIEKKVIAPAEAKMEELRKRGR